MYQKHLKAIEGILAGEWDTPHQLVQDLNDLTACHIHAILHKIEGDKWNSEYWYRRAVVKVDFEKDAMEEVKELKLKLEK